MPSSARASVPAPPSRRLVLVLGGLAMVGPFTIDTMFPAFPQMAAQFGADTLAMQQTLSVYLLAYAVMSLVHGPLSDAVGRRRVILGGLAVFTLASIGCALSPDLPTLLAFRVLQGMSAGVGMIVGRAVIRDVLQGEAAQRLMSHVSMLFAIAPAVAPILGGWIVGWARWPAIFWFLAALGVTLLLIVWRALPETHPPAARFKPSPKQLLRTHWYMARNPRFLRFTAAGGFNFAALFLYIASAPAFVLEHLRLQEDQFGWFFVPTIFGMSLGSYLSGRLAGRLSATRTAGLGFAICLTAAAGNLAYNLAVDRPDLWAVLPLALNALGIALVFPILTLAILDMYPRQRGAASSMQAFGSLLLQTAVAGALSPLLSHDARHLAAGAAACGVLGFLLWGWEIRQSRRMPPSPPEECAAVRPPTL